MSLRGKYPGYPRYVVVAMWKCGTKTLNEVFTSLGFKVFDLMQMSDYAKEFNQFGKEEIDFAQLAKIWEENEVDVIIEPAGLYWNWMVDHWPKTKFIHAVRDEASWKKSYSEFSQMVYSQKTGLEHLLANNTFLSPTVNEGVVCMQGYTSNMCGAAAYQKYDTTWETMYPWPRFLTRYMRQFNADVIVNAPKDRTLFNYSVKDGWPPLRKFLGIEDAGEGEEFPHANKGKNADTFIDNLWNDSLYRQRYVKELTDYLKQFGLTVTEDK